MAASRTACSLQTVRCVVWKLVYRSIRLTRIANATGPVDCPLKRRGDGVSVGDDGDVGGLVVDLGASAHCPRPMKRPEQALRFDAERRFPALGVGVVELDRVETTTRVERVLAQQKFGPRTNLASTSTASLHA